MNFEEKIKLINDLKEETEKLQYRDESKLDAIKRNAKMVIRNIFGDSSTYLKDISSIAFYPMVYPVDKNYEIEVWESGKQNLINMFNTMQSELMLFEANLAKEKVQKDSNKHNDLEKEKVFIVHGHDEAIKNDVARTIESLGLNAIILHEQVNKGRTTIEKFEEESQEISMAIILLSGDDICVNKENPHEKTTRARQNVIFELGYFIGKLGRERVIALYSEDKDFQLPSDYSGVIYIKYDGSGAWKLQVGKELKSCGLNIDLNRLI